MKQVMNGTEIKKVDPEKAVDILRWILFDTTELTESERETVGAALFFVVEEVEEIYDKYNKEK